MNSVFRILVGTIVISQAQANLITNGSFEDPDGVFTIGMGGFETLSGGSTKISGWTVGETSVEWVLGPAGGPGLWEASDGSFSIDLEGSPGPGSISTTFATSVGQPILVTFDFSGNPFDDGSDPVKTMHVQVNGDAAGSFSYDTVAQGNSFGNMLYLQESFGFIATEVSTTLSFSSMAGGNTGPVLDNVVATIPEPSDIDISGSTDAADIDSLRAAIRDGSTDLRFDLDDSMIVDLDDVTYLVETVLGSDFGDADLNGLVTGSGDGAILLANLGGVQGNKGWADGDFDGDQHVTASADGGVLLENLGNDATAVPEPASVLMVILALVGLARYQRSS